MARSKKTERPQFDRIVATCAALVVVCLGVYLLVRNEPIADPRLFLVMRVLLSFSTALLGATIPGFLEVGWSGTGLAIRAGGALALFVLTFLYTPNLVIVEGQNSPSSTIAQGGVVIGRDNNNSPITINPDPNKRSCRDPSHGVEKYGRTLAVTRDSPEMGGGHNQSEWCNNLIGALRGEFPGGSFQSTGSGEHINNHCAPFNCPQYVYTCTVQVQADPVYVDKISPACR